MYRKNIFIVVVLLLNSLYYNLKASEIRVDSTGLNIGDKVPEIIFKNVLNSKQNTFKLSDFKGKLVILDFWATWCVPCVKAMPKLDSLQRKFKNEIAIIPVTHENTDVVSKFISKTKSLQNLSMPIITATSLIKYFPFRVLPHEVWIDGDGNVIAITDPEDISEKNIQTAIAKKALQLKQKKDVMVDDITLPMLVGGLGDYKFTPKQVLYNSTLTEGFEGLATSVQNGYGYTGNITFMRCNNVYLQYLYKAALIKGNRLNPENSNFFKQPDNALKHNSRTIWEAMDSTLFVGVETNERQNKIPYKDRLFNYELRLPISDSLKLNEEMLYDLNRYFGSKFGIIGAREKRKVKCYALTITGDEKLFKSKGEPKMWKVSRTENGFEVKNVPIDELLFNYTSFLLHWDFKTPLINETSYEKGIDLNLGNIDPKNFEDFNNSLKRYGLQFILVERELDMIVIKDKNR